MRISHTHPIIAEHGGSGQGVIGALAGAALRLSGNDGRFKGKIKIISDTGMASVREIMSQTKAEAVRNLDGTVILTQDEMVKLGDHIKTIGDTSPIPGEYRPRY